MKTLLQGIQDENAQLQAKLKQIEIDYKSQMREMKALKDERDLLKSQLQDAQKAASDMAHFARQGQLQHAHIQVALFRLIHAVVGGNGTQSIANVPQGIQDENAQLQAKLRQIEKDYKSQMRDLQALKTERDLHKSNFWAIQNKVQSIFFNSVGQFFF